MSRHSLGEARGHITVQYEGFVVRQDLVDYCQGQIPRIQHHVEQLEAARGLTDDPEKIIAFNETISRLFGEQTALRNLCEWAKDHVVKEGNDGQ